MVSGEFESMCSLHKTLPRLVPTPYAWGTYAANFNIHFFLCRFVEMADELPDVQELSALLAELHQKGVNPEGKYGFPVPTLQGTIPQYTDWEDSWETFFFKSIQVVMNNEEKSQGSDPEMQELCKATLEKVVPRLLRPLETGGRSIQPRLIHGDIWDGNVSTDLETNTPVIFDATSIYGHNERKWHNKYIPAPIDAHSRARTITAGPTPNGETICEGVFQAFPALQASGRSR